MKSIIVGAIVALSTSVTAEYQEYMAKYGKSYTSKSDFEARKARFEHSKTLVQNHNSKPDASFELELNKFADMT
jgi:hypothetical protein